MKTNIDVILLNRKPIIHVIIRVIMPTVKLHFTMKAMTVKHAFSETKNERDVFTFLYIYNRTQRATRHSL